MPHPVARVPWIALVITLIPIGLAGQKAPSVAPSSAEFDGATRSATFVLTGTALEAWREAWVEDGRGRPHPGFRVVLGRPDAKGRELHIEISDAPAGRYKIVVSDGRSTAALDLDLAVAEEAGHTEAPLTAARVQSSYSDDVVQGRPYRLELRTNGRVPPGQTARLTSSDPALLPVPAEVDLRDFQYTMIELEAPAATAFDPPYPKTVTIKAESGGETFAAEARVYVEAYLDSLSVGYAPYEALYPNRFVPLVFHVEKYDAMPSGHTVQFTTNRPEVWRNFPTAPVSTGQGVSFQLGVFADPGPVEITADDGLRSHTLTLELGKPELTGVSFELVSVDGAAQSTEWVTELESDQIGVRSSATSFYEGALSCKPTFDFEPTAEPWTESVTLSTDRPDLVNVGPAEVTFESVGLLPQPTVISPCSIDFSSVTGPTPVTVTATYGDQVASGTLDLLPGMPAASAVYFREPGASQNWRVTEESTAELWIYLDRAAPPGTEAEITMQWVNTSFPGSTPDPAEILPLPSSLDLSGYGAGERITIEVTAGALPEDFTDEWAQVRVEMSIGTWSETYIVSVWNDGG